MTTKKSKPVPFHNDISYIEAESGWVRARCNRLKVEQEAAIAAAEPSRHAVGVRKTTASTDLERRLAAAKEAEDAFRAEVDSRMVATMDAGGHLLAIDDIVAKQGLDTQERTILLLTVLSALDESIEDTLNVIGTRGYCGQPTPEIVWLFMGLGFQYRIEARTAYLPTSRLVKAGLLTLTSGKTLTPRDLRYCNLEVTQKGFDAVLGLDINKSDDVDG